MWWTSTCGRCALPTRPRAGLKPMFPPIAKKTCSRENYVTLMNPPPRRMMGRRVKGMKNTKLYRLITGILISVLMLAGCGPAATPTPAPTAVVNTPQPSPTAAAGATAPTKPQATETTPALENASAFPDPAGLSWNLVVDGLTKPTDLVDPADGSGRLLVLA